MSRGIYGAGLEIERGPGIRLNQQQRGHSPSITLIWGKQTRSTRLRVCFGASRDDRPTTCSSFPSDGGMRRHRSVVMVTQCMLCVKE